MENEKDEKSTISKPVAELAVPSTTLAVNDDIGGFGDEVEKKEVIEQPEKKGEVVGKPEKVEKTKSEPKRSEVKGKSEKKGSPSKTAAEKRKAEKETAKQEKETKTETESTKTETIKEKDSKSETEKGGFRVGSIIMAKVHANVSKNIWFPAKILNTRVSAVGLKEYHVHYQDENLKDLKEWVAEKFIASPINTNEPPPPASFLIGSMALGWRKKPGSPIGWYYSVKVIRYLSDVPGAYVHWMDFPFPDSILESGKVFPIVTETKSPEPQQVGVKRQLSEGESDVNPKKEKVSA